MMQSLKLILLAALATAMLDALWFGVVARDAYQRYLAPLQELNGAAFTVHLPTAAVVYFLLSLGVVLFVLPRVAPGDRTAGFVWGALFGFVVYGIYDLTNYAILERWSSRLVVIDMLWGTFAIGIVSWLLVGIREKLGG